MKKETNKQKYLFKKGRKKLNYKNIYININFYNRKMSERKKKEGKRKNKESRGDTVKIEKKERKKQKYLFK